MVNITTIMGDLKKIVAFPEYPNFKTTIQDQISYINRDFEFLLRAHIYSKITQYSKYRTEMGPVKTSLIGQNWTKTSQK